MSDRTPGPWEVNTLAGSWRTEVFAGTHLVCEVIGGQEHLGQARNLAQDEANAAFIVRACNAHDNMLAALREIEEIADEAADVDDGIPNMAMRILVIVRDAISKAAVTSGERGLYETKEGEQ